MIIVNLFSQCAENSTDMPRLRDKGKMREKNESKGKMPLSKTKSESEKIAL